MSEEETVQPPARQPENVRVVGAIGAVYAFNEGIQSWSEYIEVLEHYFTANSVIDDKVKVAILCANVGPKTYHVMKNLCLPAKPSDKSFSDLKKLIKDHYKPKISEASASLIFHNRTQKTSESIQVFVAELRRLAGPCNYGDSLQRILRDRFITGINDKDIQQKILAVEDKDLTFEKAYNIAVAHEAAVRNVRELQRGGQEDESKVNFARSNSARRKQHTPKAGHLPSEKEKRSLPKEKRNEKRKQKPDKCFRCGNNHNPNVCWYKSKECHQCGKRGHIKLMCGKVGHLQDNESGSESDSDSELEEKVQTMRMYKLKSKPSKFPPILVHLQMDGQEVSLEMDTGAPCTMISKDTAERITDDLEKKLKKNKAKLTSFTGHHIDILGSLQVNVGYNGLKNYVDVLVSEFEPNLLGRDLIDLFNVIKVNVVNEVNVERVSSEPNVSVKRKNVETDQKNVVNGQKSVHSDKQRIDEVLDKHKVVFNKDLGQIKGVRASIHVDTEVKPIFFKPRPLPYAMKSKVEKELERLERENVIEPVKYSDWAAPVVPVLKQNGELRLCGDYKVTVNRVSRIEQYPIPTLDELMNKLGQGSVYHKLDLSHAYSQLELDEGSQQYTTINTHKGLYQYTRLPYGISSAPAIFQRVMDVVVKDIPSVAVYLDDILVTGSTVEESIENLNVVLARLEEFGLRLKKEKCEFGVETVTYLGHRINKEGLTPVPEKVEAIQEAKPPENVTQLKAYLGLLNYYGRFLKNLSHELHPLHKLLKKDQEFEWGAEQQKCFEKTKRMILSAKVLVHYNPMLPLVLHCDASSYGLGAVLSNVMPDGTEHPIGFVSRTMNDAEKNYSQLDKEGAAIIFGVKRFHKYVYGRAFNIVTDHKPLISLFHEEKEIPVNASPRVQRWGVFLRGYDYHMEYRPGADHQNADALSRLPLKETIPAVEDSTVFALREVEEVTLLTAEEVAQWTKYDPVLSHVHEFVLRGWPEDDDDARYAAFRVRKEELSVQDGVILWGARVVIPNKGRERMLKELHVGHPGVSRMKALARSYIWYPGLDKDIEKLVSSCEVCQQHRKEPAPAPLHPWEYPEGPWKRIHIDYAGPYKDVMLLIVVDAYSKWMEVYITKSTSSETTIKKLRECFAVHGLPDTIVSDNAAYFRSEEFAEFTRKNGIQHIFSAPGHPASNGLAERAVQTVKAGIEKTEGDSLHTKLYRFLLQYRITPHTTTGKSPAELLFNRKLSTVLDRVHPSMRKKVQGNQMKMKEHHDKTSRSREMQVGEVVRAKNFASGPKWLNGIISQKTGPVSYEVKLEDGRVIRRHVDHLYSCHRNASVENHVEVSSFIPPSIGTPSVSLEGGKEETPVLVEKQLEMFSSQENDNNEVQDKGLEILTESVGNSTVTESIVQNSPVKIEPRRSTRVTKTPAKFKDFIRD